MGNIRSLWDSSGSCLRTLARMRNTSFSGLVPQSLSVPLFLWVYSSLEESVYCCLGHTLERIASGSPNKQTTKTRRGDGTRGVTESATTACNSCSRSSTDSQSIRYDAMRYDTPLLLKSNSPIQIPNRNRFSGLRCHSVNGQRVSVRHGDVLAPIAPKKVLFWFDSFRFVSIRLVSSRFVPNRFFFVSNLSSRPNTLW